MNLTRRKGDGGKDVSVFEQRNPLTVKAVLRIRLVVYYFICARSPEPAGH